MTIMPEIFLILIYLLHISSRKIISINKREIVRLIVPRKSMVAFFMKY